MGNLLNRSRFLRLLVRGVVLTCVAILLVEVARRVQVQIANVSTTRGAAIVGAFGLLELILIAAVLHIFKRV
jgi:ATP/ADP translocase